MVAWKASPSLKMSKIGSLEEGAEGQAAERDVQGLLERKDVTS